ncbi:hypothetical protein JZ785_20155 [Alicyclobacillus curvatus]|nr:hypothetical protein JZ785_20155 [Alicyclobacillus curvatus]
MKHRNLYVSLVVVLAVVAGGGWYLEHKVTGEVANQVLAVVSNTSVKNELAGLSNNPLLANAAGLYAGNNPSNPQGQAATSGNSTGSGSKSGQGTSAGAKNPSGASGQGSGTQSSTSSTGQQSNHGQGGQASGHAGQGQTSTGASGAPTFTSRQQLIQFAMSRFTTSQIANYVRLYAERASLSPQQKAQIKQQILSHFSATEIQDMAAAAKRLH